MFGLPIGELLATLAVVLVIGALIGSVGIGGLLLAPVLVGIVHMEAREAIATSMAAFIATGALAIWMFSRNRAAVPIRWPLILATMPGALAGSLVLWALPDDIAIVALAAFLILTGLRLPLVALPAGGATETTSLPADLQIGGATGFVSALTGTGGPMVLVPLLAWRGAPLMGAIALGQIVQLPISAMATAGNYVAGGVNIVAGAVIGALLLPGVVVGRMAAERLPLALLTRGLAGILIAAGIWLILRLF